MKAPRLPRRNCVADFGQSGVSLRCGPGHVDGNRPAEPRRQGRLQDEVFVTRAQLPGSAGSTHTCPVVYLHIGAPKSGTTFIQNVLWRNKEVLAEQGVVLPG